MYFSSHLWVTVLAGGNGCRLAGVTRDAGGGHVPKQFYRFGPGGSPLCHVLGRALRLAPAARVVTMVQEAHRRWWAPELAATGCDNVIAQPANRGTGVAVLHALGAIAARDPDPLLLVLPADHEVDDEEAWERTLAHACDAALRAPTELVLVGVDAPIDPDFGWVVPRSRAGKGPWPVATFVEKPDTARTSTLSAAGAMCSTFAFAATGGALLGLFRRRARPLLRAFVDNFEQLAASPPAGTRIAELPACDFSRDVLQLEPESVRVLTAPDCGWTDLGTPGRVERWRHRRTPRRRRPSAESRHELLASGGERGG